METKFENLSPDLIIEIALMLDIDEILGFCLTADKNNLSVCENKFFWLKRLKLDYGITNHQILPNQTPKNHYRYIKNELDDNPNHILRLASDNNNIILAGVALDHGANINFIEGYPIKRAIVNNNLDMIKYLMSRGANYNINNNVVIYIASREGNLDILKYFVSWGVLPDRHTKDRSIKIAKKKGYDDIVDYLQSL